MLPPKQRASLVPGISRVGHWRLDERGERPQWHSFSEVACIKSRPRRCNIGNHTPVQLMDFIGTIESALGQTAKKNFLPMQDGDVQATYADIDELVRDTGFKPATTLEYGIGKWVEWYRGYKRLG